MKSLHLQNHGRRWLRRRAAGAVHIQDGGVVEVARTRALVFVVLEVPGGGTIEAHNHKNTASGRDNYGVEALSSMLCPVSHVL